MREIWDGTGDVGEKAYWTLNSGEMKGRPYVRTRATEHLSRWASRYSLDQRRVAIARTIDNDAWMASRNGQTVASLLPDVVMEMICGA